MYFLSLLAVHELHGEDLWSFPITIKNVEKNQKISKSKKNPKILKLRIKIWRNTDHFLNCCCLCGECEVVSTFVSERETNTKTHAKCVMWTCRRTTFAYAVYVRQIGKHYPSGVGTSKKNTFAIILMWMYIHLGSQRITSGTLARSLVRRTLNKQLFGIHLYSPRSRMPCLRSRTDVDAAWNKPLFACMEAFCRVRLCLACRVQMWTRLHSYCVWLASSWCLHIFYNCPDSQFCSLNERLVCWDSQFRYINILSKCLNY